MISVVDIDDNTTKVVLYLNPKETKEFKFRYLNPYKALDLNVLKLPIKIEDEQGNVIYNDSLEFYSSSNVVKYYQILDKNPNVGIVSNKKLEIIKQDSYMNNLVIPEYDKEWITIRSGQIAHYMVRDNDRWKPKTSTIYVNKLASKIQVYAHAWTGDCGEAKVRNIRVKVYDKDEKLIKDYTVIGGTTCGYSNTVTIDLENWYYVSRVELYAELWSSNWNSDDKHLLQEKKDTRDRCQHHRNRG